MIFQVRKFTIIAVTAFLVFMVFLIYGPLSDLKINFYSPHFSLQSKKIHCGGIKNISEEDWKNIDLSQRHIPDALRVKAETIQVLPGTVIFEDVEIHYQQAGVAEPNRITVLFLHGQSFDSTTWKELHSIQLCAALGFHTIAIDLPGFGLSSKASMSFNKDFLANFIYAMNVVKPVIITPSISGAFSLPYVIDNWKNLTALVPVSPIGTTVLEKNHCMGRGKNMRTEDHKCQTWIQSSQHEFVSDLGCIKLPVMVVCGERDNKLSSSRLCHLPLSKGVEIADAAHAAYMSDPKLFHELLYNLLTFVSDC